MEVEVNDGGSMCVCEFIHLSVEQPINVLMPADRLRGVY